MLRKLATVVRRVLRKVGFSNLQELGFGGLLPEDTAFKTALYKSEKYVPVDGRGKLRDYIEDLSPKVLVTFIGIGSRGGFLLPMIEEGERSLLPDTWWRLESQEVFLFAFSCYSAEYIEASDIRRYLAGALCYEGEVWIAVDAGEYWLTFIDRIRSVIRRTSGVGGWVYSKVLKEYSKALRPGRGDRSNPGYLIQISLVRQVRQLRVLHGGGL